MHVLLTNDDGIDAPGIAALEMAVGELAKVTVVAPDRGYSGCGHQVTSHGGIRVEQIAPRHFKVSGTPADCTRLAITEIAPDIDWVLSGVNYGGNLGVDLWMSGTAAAAREAVWLGKPAIALSQYVRRDRERDWSKTQEIARRTIEALWRRKPSQGYFWNVNFPDVDTPSDQIEMIDAFPETRHMLVDFQCESTADAKVFTYNGDYRNRPQTPGSDVNVCFGGAIAVSQVSASV